MSYLLAQELRDQKCKIAHDLQEILDRAEKDKRDLSDEEWKKWEDGHKEVESLTRRIDLLERQEGLRKNTEAEEKRAREIAGRVEREAAEAAQSAGLNEPEEKRSEPERSQRLAAFDHWCRYGTDGMEPEMRQALGGLAPSPDFEIRTPQPPGKELRAPQTTQTGATGGFTIPEDWVGVLTEAMKAWGSMLDAGTIIQTTTGAKIPWPTMNDTAQKGAIIAENVADASQEITFGQIPIEAYTYTSKLILVPYELLQDNEVNLEGQIPRVAGTRIGRILEEHFTKADGTAKPNGAVTASTLGFTAAANNALTWDELLELEHSVDPAYRSGPKSGFMLNDSTLLAVKKLKSTDGLPIWQPSVRVGEPDRIDGKRYWVNQEMASIATVAKSVLFGDFSLYLIRQARGFATVRLVERFADSRQVGFFVFARYDGDLLDAGTNPIKHLAHPV